jgi:hypothetical protein
MQFVFVWCADVANPVFTALFARFMIAALKVAMLDSRCTRTHATLRNGYASF